VAQTGNFKNSRWPIAAILKIVKTPYFRKKSSNFNAVCTIADFDLAASCEQTNENIIEFTMVGGCYRLLKSFFSQ